MDTVVNPPPDHGPGSVPAFRHWIHGFLFQTIIYGINTILFLMSLWVLAIHIIKGSHIHRFHKHHMLQNCALLLYTVVMFAFSTVLMAHEGILTKDAWLTFLTMTNESGSDLAAAVISRINQDRGSLHKTCSALFVLVNWGTVGILLWRCLVHWKVRSIFPVEIMVLPYLLFVACVGTGLLRIIQDVAQGFLSGPADRKNWALDSWAISTALYYLLTILIAVRILYHRYVIQKEVGAKDVNKLAGYLTIFYDSGAIVLPFSTAYLVALARFPDLIYVFESTVMQNQVLLSLLIIQRLAAGRAWSGKTIDCILNARSRPAEQTVGKHAEEVTTMGFNPNTEISSTRNDVGSERSSEKGRPGLTVELRDAMSNRV